MGKMGNNKFMKGVTGKVGNVSMRNSIHGQIMQNLPPKGGKKSPKQKEQMTKFRLATLYAKGIKRHPDLSKIYARGINAKQVSVHHVAQNDYLIAPEVIYIKTEKYTGTIGDMIMIKATDNFQVMRVMVQIKDSKGKLIERGDATPYPRRPKLWRYYATVENAKTKGCVVNVIAEDRPGNRTEMEVGVGEVS